MKKILRFAQDDASYCHDDEHGRSGKSFVILSAAKNFVSLLTIVALIVGLIYPLFCIFKTSLGARIHLFDSDILFIVKVSVFQAALSAIVSWIVGFFFGIWLSRHSEKKILKLLLSIPFGIPGVVAAFAWIQIFSALGILRWGFGWSAVIFAQIFLNIPLVALLVLESAEWIPFSQIEAARTLGAGALQRFRSILFPQLIWPSLAAAAQVFSLCLMSFAIILILGGGPPVESLETAIYSELRQGLQMYSALSFALWQIFLNAIAWGFVLIAQKKFRKTSQLELDLRRPKISRVEKFSSLSICFLFILPYAISALGIFKSLSLLVSKDFFQPFLISARSSLELAALSGIFSLALAIGCIQIRKLFRATHLWDVAITVVASVSILVLSAGILLAYSSHLDLFAGNLFTIALIQGIFFLPLAYRWLWPHLSHRQNDALDSARILGASATRAFIDVELPRWKIPLLTAFALIFVASLGELASVSFFYSENFVPLPLLLSRFISRYQFAEAEAVSSLLFFISVISLIFVYRKSYERK